MSRDEAEALSRAIVEVKDRVRFCSRCFSLTEEDPCALCSDERRDRSVLCVVGEAKDVYAIERTMSFRGRYHVLGGLISPMEGIGVGQLHVKELLDRVNAEGIKEVIVATNPERRRRIDRALPGAAADPVRRGGVTRLAYGLPIGGDLDYADEVTLARALEGRRAL